MQFSLEMRIKIDWFTITFRFPSSIGIEWNYKEVSSFRFDQENDNFLDANIYRKNSHSFRLDAFTLEMRIQIWLIHYYTSISLVKLRKNLAWILDL